MIVIVTIEGMTMVRNYDNLEMMCWTEERDIRYESNETNEIIG